MKFSHSNQHRMLRPCMKKTSMIWNTITHSVSPQLSYMKMIPIMVPLIMMKQLLMEQQSSVISVVHQNSSALNRSSKPDPQPSTQSSVGTVGCNRHVTKTKTYRCFKTISNPRPRYVGRTRLVEKLDSLTDTEIRQIVFCPKLKWISMVKSPFIRSKIELFRLSDMTQRQNSLSTISDTDEKFYFDCSSVCSKFLFRNSL